MEQHIVTWPRRITRVSLTKWFMLCMCLKEIESLTHGPCVGMRPLEGGAGIQVAHVIGGRDGRSSHETWYVVLCLSRSGHALVAE